MSELREDEKRNAKEKGKDTHLNAEYQRTARLQQYVNRELPDVQAGFRKSRGTKIKLPTSIGSQKKQENSRKYIDFCFTEYAKALHCVDHNKLLNIFKEMGKYQTSSPAS